MKTGKPAVKLSDQGRKPTTDLNPHLKRAGPGFEPGNNRWRASAGFKGLCQQEFVNFF